MKCRCVKKGRHLPQWHQVPRPCITVVRIGHLKTNEAFGVLTKGLVANHLVLPALDEFVVVNGHAFRLFIFQLGLR